jgi:hypothetical protein
MIIKDEQIYRAEDRSFESHEKEEIFLQARRENCAYVLIEGNVIDSTKPLGPSGVIFTSGEGWAEGYTYEGNDPALQSFAKPAQPEPSP